MLSKMKKQNNKEKNKKLINQLLTVITKQCEHLDWHWTINALDNKEYNSAIIAVNKSVDFQEISAFINILVAPDNIEYSIEKTSFYKYGIETLWKAILNALEKKGHLNKSKGKDPIENPTITALLNLFKRFHVSALQLTKRHANRATLIINDEYDVQDYIHALLKINFNDVRPEEFTPSYAGSSSRIDFLLKDEQILIEIKYASSTLKDTKVGEQLIVDIERYKKHPDCKTLICFVYDPNYVIKNPYGIEKDLTGKKDKLDVFVYIYPK
jgi:hypothetical protein